MTALEMSQTLFSMTKVRPLSRLITRQTYIISKNLARTVQLPAALRFSSSMTKVFPTKGGAPSKSKQPQV